MAFPSRRIQTVKPPQAPGATEVDIPPMNGTTQPAGRETGGGYVRQQPAPAADPTFNRPTYSPPGSTQNPAGNTPMTQPANPNGTRPTAPPAPAMPAAPPVPRLPTPPQPQATSVPPMDMRSDVYTPGNDPRLGQAQTATDRAGTAIQNMDRIGMQTGNEDRYRSVFGTGQVAGNANPSDRTNRLGLAQDQALEGLAGPNRTELAMKTLSDLEAATDRNREQAFRRVGQKNAALGRLGSGMVNAELGSVEGDLQRDLAEKRNQLAMGVAEGDINDRFRRVDATSGLRRSEYGMDADQRDYSTGLGERNEDRRFQRTGAAVDRATGQTDRSIDDLFNRFDTAGRLEDRVYQQGRGNRDEFRTERGRQDDLARQTIEDRIRQRELEMREQELRLRQALAKANAGGL